MTSILTTLKQQSDTIQKLSLSKSLSVSSLITLSIPSTYCL